MRHLVFVYGTLKKNEGAFDWYLARQEFVGHATSIKKFLVLDTRSFPVALPTEEIAPIRGEIYEVDDLTLERLDGYEGNGQMFQRTHHEFQCDTGDKITAQIYLGMPEYWQNRMLEKAPQNGLGQFQWGKNVVSRSA